MTTKFALVLCIAITGCVDTDTDTDTEQPELTEDTTTSEQAIGTGKCDGKSGCKLYTDYVVDNGRCRNRVNYTYICKSKLGAITCTDSWNTPWKPGC